MKPNVPAIQQRPKKPSVKQTAFLGYVAEGRTISEAARLAGVTPRQGHRWLEVGSPLREFLDESLAEARDQLIDRLLSLAEKSLAHFEHILDQPAGRCPAERLAVSKAVLENLVRMLELSSKPSRHNSDTLPLSAVAVPTPSRTGSPFQTDFGLFIPEPPDDLDQEGIFPSPDG
jgi:hypothetical protein